ncbi:MAG TPA: 4-hydroxy-tetrahydrodipicolinate reductase [Acidimicrobiales bacterium]|jgi:4-hydroxy-tetrahydrodipicolinate reductase|nr:4-hydroxy-tetrahydrodipicolinate reductase [Acidimicrobiales bacterium]
MTRVAVIGAAGRMGSTVVRAVFAAEGLELVAGVDPSSAGRRLDEIAGITGSGVTVSADLRALDDAGAEVAVDFTDAASAKENLLACAAHGIHAVTGTTGLSEEDLALLGERFGLADGPNCVFASNFAISAVLLMRLAEIAAPFFDSAEIVELHHDTKRDAPSGTATETARRIAVSRHASGHGDFSPDPTEVELLEGARGGRAPAGIRIHSVRLRGLVAHQEVLFGTAGQALTIRQDSLDRESFMPGVILAVRNVATTPGLTIGLDALLFPS